MKASMRTSVYAAFLISIFLAGLCNGCARSNSTCRQNQVIQGLLNNGSVVEDYESIVQALVDGYPMTFVADTELCERGDGSPSQTNLGIVSLPVNVFFGSRTGSLLYVGAVGIDIVLTENGHRLRQIQARAYEDGRARLRITYVRLNDSVAEKFDILWCPLAVQGSNGARFIRASGVQPYQLANYNELVDALKFGLQVRFATQYYGCEPNLTETVSGGLIPSFDIDEESNILSYSFGSMTTSFIFNGALAKVFGTTGRVELQPYAVHINGSQAFNLSSFDCPLNNGNNGGGTSFYIVV